MGNEKKLYKIKFNSQYGKTTFYFLCESPELVVKYLKDEGEFVFSDDTYVIKCLGEPFILESKKK